MTETLTDKIRQYVEEHPGCLRHDIAEALDLESSPQIITDLLCRLRRQNIVVNEVPNGQKSQTRWYPAETRLFSSNPS